jgi:hypothetical protein
MKCERLSLSPLGEDKKMRGDNTEKGKGDRRKERRDSQSSLTVNAPQFINPQKPILQSIIVCVSVGTHRKGRPKSFGVHWFKLWDFETLAGMCREKGRWESSVSEPTE